MNFWYVLEDCLDDQYSMYYRIKQAAHRRATLMLAVLYKLWPRFSFVYAYVFEYYDVFLPLWHCTHSYSEEGAQEPLEVSHTAIV